MILSQCMGFSNPYDEYEWLSLVRCMVIVCVVSIPTYTRSKVLVHEGCIVTLGRSHLLNAEDIYFNYIKHVYYYYGI